MKQSRWRSFSLRSLLALVAVIGCCLGAAQWQIARFQRRWAAEQKVTKRLQELDAVLKTETRGSEWLRWMAGKDQAEIFVSTIHVRIVGKRLVEDDLVLMGQLQELESLELLNCGVMDDWLAHIGQLSRLNALDLYDNPGVTDSGLWHLREMTSICRIELAGTRVAGPGLRHLTRMRDLEVLTVQYASLTRQTREDSARRMKMPEGVLSQFKSLRRLTLVDIDLEDADLSSLRYLPNLQSLSINCANITDTGFDELRLLRNLASLSVPNTQITDVALRDLPKLKKLKTIDASNTRLTDKSFEYFAKCPRLTTLDLTGTYVSDACFEYLAQMPQLEMVDVDNTMISRTGVTSYRRTYRHPRYLIYD